MTLEEMYPAIAERLNLDSTLPKPSDLVELDSLSMLELVVHIEELAETPGEPGTFPLIRVWEDTVAYLKVLEQV